MTTIHTVPGPTVDVCPEEQDLHWRRTVHERLAGLDLRRGSRSHGQGSAVARDVGDLLVTDWQCPPDVVGVRRSAMAAKETESLLLFMVTGGRQVVETPTQTVVLGPGVALLTSTRITGRIVVPDAMTKRTLRVPSTALAPHDTGAGIPDLLCVDIAANPLAQLTQGFLDHVDAQLPHMTAPDVESARNALLVLIAGMMRAAHAPDLNEADFLPFLRRSLEDWIVDHLRGGAIRVGDLATAHSVAPRTVHRAFATTGDTMGSVVRAHRLAAVRNDLVHTASSIAAIAHAWGFCDASHLGREFRREFSMSPGDYRAAHGLA